MTSSVIAVAGALAGALIGSGFAFASERKRAADADKYRNHAQRADAAVDFLKAIDCFRRDVKDRKSAADQSGRDLADVIGRVALFFDDDVVELARRAQAAADGARTSKNRERLLADSATARDAARAEMKKRLEPSAKLKHWP